MTEMVQQPLQAVSSFLKIFALFFLVSCSGRYESDVSKLRQLPDEGTSPELASKPQFIDSMISGIELGDSTGVFHTFGDLSSITFESDSTLPNACIKNADKNEQLILTKWPGDGVNSFRYVQVMYADKKSCNYVSGVLNFTSGKGISLGASLEQLVQVLGDEYEEDQGVITYFDDEYLYQAKYTFEANNLIKFEFGYLYP